MLTMWITWYKYISSVSVSRSLGCFASGELNQTVSTTVRYRAKLDKHWWTHSYFYMSSYNLQKKNENPRRTGMTTVISKLCSSWLCQTAKLINTIITSTMKVQSFLCPHTFSVIIPSSICNVAHQLISKITYNQSISKMPWLTIKCVPFSFMAAERNKPSVQCIWSNTMPHYSDTL